MLSHIPSKVHAKDDTIMNVPELFSTISRLKAFALLARTENRIRWFARHGRPLEKHSRRSSKSEDDFIIKESASSFKKTSSSSSTMCLSHLLFLKVRPSDAKKEIELDVVAALRIASILYCVSSSRFDVYCYARINIYIYI